MPTRAVPASMGELESNHADALCPSAWTLAIIRSRFAPKLRQALERLCKQCDAIQ